MQRILLFSLCCLALSRGQVIILPDGTLAQWPPVQHPIHQIPIQQIPIQQIPIQQIPVQQYPIQQLPIQPIQVQGVEDDTYDAKVGEFPYQVSILVDGRHICGGSLISKKHVLTAAHCTHPLIVARKDKNTIKVLVGTNNLQRGGTYMDVDRISEHGQFRPPSEVAPIMLNDIAVIRLKEEVVESDTVKVIGLPAPQQEVADNTQLILSGFGASYINGPISVKLRKIQMLATNHQTCAVNWSNRGSITTGHLCASFGKGFGACQGDSGGPLTLADKSVVVGVVSEGIGLGCDSGWPDLYTKVSHYLDYINSELALTS